MIKKILIFIIIMVVVVFGATLLKKEKAPVTSLSSTSGEEVDILGSETVIGEEFLVTLLNQDQ